MGEIGSSVYFKLIYNQIIVYLACISSCSHQLLCQKRTTKNAMIALPLHPIKLIQSRKNTMYNANETLLENNGGFGRSATLYQQWLNAAIFVSLSRCWYNVGSASTTLNLHYTNIGSVFSSSTCTFSSVVMDPRPHTTTRAEITRRGAIGGSMLAHLLRRWPNIKPALCQHCVFWLGGVLVYMRRLSCHPASCKN